MKQYMFGQSPPNHRILFKPQLAILGPYKNHTIPGLVHQ